MRAHLGRFIKKRKEAQANREQQLRRRGFNLSQRQPRRKIPIDDEFSREIEAAICGEETNEKIHQREPVNGVQFSRVHTMIEDLVERLLQGGGTTSRGGSFKSTLGAAFEH